MTPCGSRKLRFPGKITHIQIHLRTSSHMFKFPMKLLAMEISVETYLAPYSSLPQIRTPVYSATVFLWNIWKSLYTWLQAIQIYPNTIIRNIILGLRGNNYCVVRMSYLFCRINLRPDNALSFENLPSLRILPLYTHIKLRVRESSVCMVQCKWSNFKIFWTYQ